MRTAAWQHGTAPPQQQQRFKLTGHPGSARSGSSFELHTCQLALRDACLPAETSQQRWVAVRGCCSTVEDSWEQPAL